MANATAKRAVKVAEYSGKKTKICPKCGGGPWSVEKKFGYRRTGNAIRSQSHCMTCRGKKEDYVLMTVIAEDDPLTTEETVKILAIEPGDVITLDIDQTRKAFQKTFPKNKQRYGWKTMVRRLVKKHGEGILSPEAYTELSL